MIPPAAPVGRTGIFHSRLQFKPTEAVRSRETCPGGAEFETSSAKGYAGAVLVANLTLPVLNGVSVLVTGMWLGLQISNTDDKHGNANGEFFRRSNNPWVRLLRHYL